MVKKTLKEDKKNEKLIKNLQKEVEDLKEKNIELENSWKRALADYQNYKRRSEQEKVEIMKNANENLLRELAPVLNNFDMLLQHSEDPGLKITISNFKDILKQVGVEELNLVNEVFNPSVAEAIELVEGEKDVVIEVVEKGYIYNGKVLKPARVRVGKGFSE